MSKAENEIEGYVTDIDAERRAGSYCMLDGWKGSAEDMAAMKVRCAMKGCPTCGIAVGYIPTAFESKYGRKIESTESLQCVECDEVSVTLIDGVCNTCMSKKDNDDEINWPKHYNTGKIQPIDAIEDWKLDFRLANAVKYIARHGHKEKPKKDLEKAIWYIQRFIDKELTKDDSNG